MWPPNRSTSVRHFSLAKLFDTRYLILFHFAVSFTSWPETVNILLAPFIFNTCPRSSSTSSNGCEVRRFSRTRHWNYSIIRLVEGGKKKEKEGILCNYLHGVIVIVNDSYDTSRGWLSTARRWCFVSDGSFPAEARHRRWSTLPSTDATSDARSTSATTAGGTRVPGVALLPIAGRLSLTTTN